MGHQLLMALSLFMGCRRPAARPWHMGDELPGFKQGFRPDRSMFYFIEVKPPIKEVK